MRRAALLAILPVLTAQTPPLPLPRPATEAVPVPVPRPDTTAPAPPAATPPAPPAPATAERPPPPPVEPPPPLSEAAFAACLESLRRLGAQADPVPAIADGACQASQPLRLTALADGVTLTQPVTMLCPAALAFATWVREDVQPRAERAGAPLAQVQTGPGYECRNRNRAANGRLSEHAFANAVDISGFVLRGGRTIAVKPAAPEPTDDDRFIADVRAAACRHFTTVIGPGEVAHDNHLHVDLRQRRGGFRLCQ